MVMGTYNYTIFIIKAWCVSIILIILRNIAHMKFLFGVMILMIMNTIKSCTNEEEEE